MALHVRHGRDLEKAGAGYAYQVERSRFDQILLNNARRRGVEVREQHAVLQPLLDDGRVTGVRFTDVVGREHTARARFVVDASGNASPLYRPVGRPRLSEFFRNVALFCYFHNAGRMPGDQAGSVLSAAFDEGWFWYIPLSDTLTSVGAVIAQRTRRRSSRQDHEQAMRGFIDSCPLIGKLLADGARASPKGPYGQFRVRKDYSYYHDRVSGARAWSWSETPPASSIRSFPPACTWRPTRRSWLARSINSVLRGGVDERRAFTEFERRYRRGVREHL